MCILISYEINAICQPAPPDHEYVVVDVVGRQANVRVACFYVTNAGSHTERGDRIRSYCDEITRCCDSDSSVIIVGDFNLPGLQSNGTIPNTTASHEATFSQCCLQNGLQQLVQLPTHTSGSMLDLVLTTEPSIIENMHVFDSPMISDHRAIGFDVTFDFSMIAPCPDCLDFRNMNRVAIAEQLDKIDWPDFFAHHHGVNDMDNAFTDLCRSLIRKFTPTRRRTQSRSSSS